MHIHDVTTAAAVIATAFAAYYLVTKQPICSLVSGRRQSERRMANKGRCGRKPMCLIAVVTIAVCERQIDPEIILCPHTHTHTEPRNRISDAIYCTLFLIFIYILSLYHHVSFRLILMLLLLL